jgi:hypothetical protein
MNACVCICVYICVYVCFRCVSNSVSLERMILGDEKRMCVYIYIHIYVEIELCCWSMGLGCFFLMFSMVEAMYHFVSIFLSFPFLISE